MHHWVKKWLDTDKRNLEVFFLWIRLCVFLYHAFIGSFSSLPLITYLFMKTHIKCTFKISEHHPHRFVSFVGALLLIDKEHEANKKMILHKDIWKALHFFQTLLSRTLFSFLSTLTLGDSWRALSNSSRELRCNILGPATTIPIAPIDDVMRITRTAIVKICHNIWNKTNQFNR